MKQRKDELDLMTDIAKEKALNDKYLLTIAEIAPIQEEWEDKAVDYFSRPEEEQTGPLPEHWDAVLCKAQHLKTLRVQAEELQSKMDEAWRELEEIERKAVERRANE